MMMRLNRFIGPANKERLIDCLRGRSVDRVPHFEILIEDAHVEQLLGRKAGNTLGVGGNPAKGSREEAIHVRPMDARDYLELCQMIGQDAMAVKASWTPIKIRRPDGTVALWNDRSFKAEADLERVVWPDETDMEERLQYIREYVSAATDTGIGVIFNGGSLFQTLCEYVIGMHDCLIMVMEQRELFKYLMSRSADYFSELTRRAIEAGVDVVYFGDDIAFNSGLFIRPEILRDVWLPYFERISEPARQKGIPIMFHSDGKIDEVVEWLVDMGVGSINPMDPSGIDYRDYKRRYGHRVTLHGNIDLTWPLATGTPEDIASDVKAHADILKPGGRWIASSSHSIVDYMPHENFLAMINAFHRYGLY